MSNDLVRQEENEQISAMLAQHEGPTGLEGGKRFVSPPFARVVQQMSKELKKTYPEGTLVIPKLDVIVCEPGESIEVTPLIMIPSYQASIPYTDAPQGCPVSFYRTTDENSEIAQIALRKNIDDRWTKVTHDGKEYDARAYESLVVAFVAHTGPAAGLPFIRSFQLSQFKYGKNMMAYAMFRLIDQKRVPLYWNKFILSTFLDSSKDKKNEYWSTKIENPGLGERRFIDQSLMGAFQGYHDTYQREVSSILDAADLEDVADEQGHPVDGTQSM